ncbi:MAG: DUF5107 domain-containing protein [Anaerolineae bacterium]|nr:DUF5107 domain-containing protein [Anaerolineae bacterium]
MVFETTLIIQTYGYEDGFLPTEPGDIVYPYPRMNHDLVTAPQPRLYKAVVLENDYVALYILPELGGRLYRWVDKITGRRLLYENPVIKPTQWGYRGWWLSAGGIEWAFPVEEHGLNEWRSWNYTVSQSGDTALITVSDTEDRTGMEVGMTILLENDSPLVMFQPWIRNFTADDHNVQYWMNAMLALNNNRISHSTEFIIPTGQVMVHSTGDSRLPGEWEWMSWPEVNGINLSNYNSWQGWLGFFVPEVSEGFTAVYDHEIEQGIVRIYNPGWPAGTKIFGPGTLPTYLWTDDSSSYIELWSGITPTFADELTIAAGDKTNWAEYWYPVHDLGGVTAANDMGTLFLRPDKGLVHIGAMVTQGTAQSLTLWQNMTQVQAWTFSLLPGQTLRTEISLTSSDNLGLHMADSAGHTLVQWGKVP